MSALVVLFVLAGMNLIFCLVLHFFALRGLQCQRHFSVPCAYEGDTVEVVEVVRNDRPLLVPWLRKWRKSWNVSLGWRNMELPDAKPVVIACSLVQLLLLSQP